MAQQICRAIARFFKAVVSNYCNYTTECLKMRSESGRRRLRVGIAVLREIQGVNDRVKEVGGMDMRREAERAWSEARVVSDRKVYRAGAASLKQRARRNGGRRCLKSSVRQRRMRYALW